jgi:hypothetical protein
MSGRFVLGPGGKETWRGVSHGRLTTIVTSGTSVAAIDEATKTYAGDLRRLADR